MQHAEVTTLPSQKFHPRVYGVGAWTDNLPFAYDLVALIKPRVLVELGVDRGESYFAFCQSAAENATGTRCFGVDSWTGDEHVGGYDETTFREVSEHNAQHYSTLSTLLRCRFDEALPQFAPESIDLLHIDGRHTESAARHDIDNWLPKLAPGGILLMHDVCVRTRGFGVWKVWDELRACSRAFTFDNGPGLGVWQKPPERTLPPMLEMLLSGSPADLVDYYAEKSREVRQQITDDWRTGAVRHNAIGNQTIVQVFHTTPFSEENSVLARIGHNEWHTLRFPLPVNAGPMWLRIDFVSPFTRIDIKAVSVSANAAEFFRANSPAEFDRIRIAGDCEREPGSDYLRLKITGIDPQLYLPELRVHSSDVTVSLMLRVSPQTV